MSALSLSLLLFVVVAFKIKIIKLVFSMVPTDSDGIYCVFDEIFVERITWVQNNWSMLGKLKFQRWILIDMFVWGLFYVVSFHWQLFQCLIYDFCSRTVVNHVLYNFGHIAYEHSIANDDSGHTRMSAWCKSFRGSKLMTNVKDNRGTANEKKGVSASWVEKERCCGLFRPNVEKV